LANYSCGKVDAVAVKSALEKVSDKRGKQALHAIHIRPHKNTHIFVHSYTRTYIHI